MFPLKTGIALGLAAAAVISIWYAAKQGMLRTGPNLSNTYWSLTGQSLNGLNMSFRTARPGEELTLTWGRSMQVTGTYRGSRIKFDVIGGTKTYTFAGVVSRDGNTIEGDVSIKSEDTPSRHFAARRVNLVTYDQPTYLLHIQAVATPRLDGQGSEWNKEMYFAGRWTTSTRAPDASGQVRLTWLSTIPVVALADQKYGPFATSMELCPAVQDSGLTLPPEMSQKLGCP